MIHITSIVILSLTLTSLSTAPKQGAPIGPELLTNPSFEEIDVKTNMPVGWRGGWSRDWGPCAGRAEVVTGQARHGHVCVKISKVKNRYALMHKKIPIQAGKAYLLSAWVKTNLRTGEAAYLVASWSSNRRWLSLQRSRALRGAKPWTHLSMFLLPEGRDQKAKFLQVSFRVYSPHGKGVAFVDVISLRECRPPQPPLASELEPRRQIELARALLAECAYWRARLQTLRARREDLRRLLSETAPFQTLVRRYGEAATRGEFLTRRPPQRDDMPVLDDAVAIREHIADVTNLPALRDRCFAELNTLLALKRKLDERPSLRRFYLWAQLASMRGVERRLRSCPFDADGDAFRRIWKRRNPKPEGALEYMEVRTALDLERDIGTVSIAAPSGLVGSRIEAAVVDASNRVVAHTKKAIAPAGVRLQMRIDSPNRWFPDCPHLYRVCAAVLQRDEVVDWAERPIAFRRIGIVETDVSATGRHAWAWAPCDYTFAINGQPFFPTGTVCGGLTEADLPAAIALFDELWLDFQRTYGNFLPRIAGPYGEAFTRQGLTFLASLSPDYKTVRYYQSSTIGFDRYRERVKEARRFASHPALLTVEVGNEAELSTWGADLAAVYGKDLWFPFNEVIRILRNGMSPDVPVGYTRAAGFYRVLPEPTGDYCGVNQYTGRYWGRRATISKDLHALAIAATYENKPVGITEWNGPKYSWATSGVSGVDEQGAAQYIFEYFQNMTRTPMIVFSTEFVLNWICTPIEDLTSVSLDEGLARRAQWRWCNQKGCPWYPRIWPGLLTDTPARRAMRGFQSPLFYLCSFPGRIVVAGHPRAGDIAKAIGRLGREVTFRAMPAAAALDSLNANLLLIGGVGDDQPPAIQRLERMGVIGRTTRSFPQRGRFLIQRRVNPFFPDRFLVVVTAADAESLIRGIDKLLLSARGLEEAFSRQASQRRAVALIDESDDLWKVFATYVLELPLRGTFLGRDDIRYRLSWDEFFDSGGERRPEWTDLSALVLAANRPLRQEEKKVIFRLANTGANIVWSAETLDANPDIASTLKVKFADTHSLTEHIPVASWIQAPLRVPELGHVAKKRIEKFGRVAPGSPRWLSAIGVRTIHTTDPSWRSVAATEGGEPVVAAKPWGRGQQWVFGCRLSRAAAMLVRVTRHGVVHRLYDRDTACGLERVFRLVANACTFRLKARAASTPRLHVTVNPARQRYRLGDTMTIRVRARDAQGAAVDANVRIGFAIAAKFSPTGVPQHWMKPTRMATGEYALRVALPPSKDAPFSRPEPWRFRGQRFLAIFVDATRPGWVADWTTQIVRVGTDSDEPTRLAQLVHCVTNRLIRLNLQGATKHRWVEVEATLTLPASLRAGKPANMVLNIRRVEDERGDDWMENVRLVFVRTDAHGEFEVPVAPGKRIAGANCRFAKGNMKRYALIPTSGGLRFELRSPVLPRGRYAIRLRYLYTDHYRIAEVNRLPLDARLGTGDLAVR